VVCVNLFFFSGSGEFLSVAPEDTVPAMAAPLVFTATGGCVLVDSQLMVS
jgi:hypothetical protein